MNDTHALICERCGAPLANPQLCDYCGTQFYLGPQVTPPAPNNIVGIEQQIWSSRVVYMRDYSTNASFIPDMQWDVHIQREML
jgi:hypothetical protein